MKKRFGVNSDFIFAVFICTIVFLAVVATLYPFIYVVSASVSDPQSVISGEMLLFPVGFTLEGYEYFMQYKELWTSYGNTLFYTVAGTFLNVIVTLPAAYAFSRRDMAHRKILMGVFVFTMYFGGGLIPSYMNVRSFGLLNTRWVMLILGLVSVYNMIVARTFFQSTIPWELQEAAQIDGAGKFKTFLTVVMPLSKPIIAVLVLYYGVGHWNSYFSAMVYLKDRSKWPLQMILREIILQSQIVASTMGSDLSAEAIAALMKQQDTANLLKYGVIVIGMAPLLILYPFLQKFFEKGVMLGSIKG